MAPSPQLRKELFAEQDQASANAAAHLDAGRQTVVHAGRDEAAGGRRGQGLEAHGLGMDVRSKGRAVLMGESLHVMTMCKS